FIFCVLSCLSSDVYVVSSNVIYTFSIVFYILDVDLQDLPYFPTRRSSDLSLAMRQHGREIAHRPAGNEHRRFFPEQGCRLGKKRDRKSTRLNSSHVSTSYAVFCLKKKKRKTIISFRYL